MRRHWEALFALASMSVAALVAFGGPAPAQTLPDPALSHRRVCAEPPGGTASCHAEVVTDSSGHDRASVAYSAGYAPSDLASAYRFSLPAPSSSWVWNGQTVALVDAYRNPNAAADLAAYRAQFQLPPCTVSSGCFTEINQSGATSPLPGSNTGWGQEIDLDIEMVSAVCPMCRILLVEANSTGLSDLGTAVNAAVNQGANAVSNSYGTSGEFNSESSYGDAYYNNHPGVAITASSGDSGYGVEFPAVSKNVTAVGGTSLTRNSGTSRGWTETTWSGTGSGCSAYIPQQPWQTSQLSSLGLTGCSMRVVGDVAAVADPSTGVAVYDSYGSTSGANWYVFGGTSVASPIIAASYVLPNAGSNLASSPATSYLYSHSGSLNDVTTGSDGRCTTKRSTATSWLCTAGVGYDGPTGLGTPNGPGAF